MKILTTDNSDDNTQYADATEKKQSALTHLINDIETRFSNVTDYYTILAVTKNSTPAEIKNAFENALQIYNIDVFTYLLGNENTVRETLKMFDKLLHDAYTTIGNASNKYYYDNKDIIKNTSDPDQLINQFIDGFVDDFDPNDKSAYWKQDELKTKTK